MNVEQRVLTALRLEQPDRVPIFVYLNPYTKNGYSEAPSYAKVMETCEEYADVIYDWYPGSLFQTAAPVQKEDRMLEDGRKEYIIHTPGGPITSGTTKRLISTVEDAEKMLSIPYVPCRPNDLPDFIRIRDQLKNKTIAQITFNDPLCEIAGNTDEEVLAVWTIEQRDLLRHMLDVMLERQLNHIRWYLDNGVGPIY